MTAALERLAAGLALAGLVLRWSDSAGVAGTGLNLFIHLLPLLALGVWLAARARAGGARLRLSGAEMPLLAFLGAGFLSVAAASYVLPALETAFGFLSAGLFAVLAGNVLGRRGLAELFLTGLAAASAYALSQYFFDYPAVMAAARAGAFGANEELLRRVLSRQPQAGFIGPNQLGAFLVAVLPLAAGAALDLRRGARALAASLAAVGLAALVLTGSLGAGVALACAAAAYAGLALTRRRGRAALVATGAALALAAVVLALASPLLAAVGARNHSIHVRRVYWQSALRVAAERPVLGTGLGNLEEHYYRVKPDVQQESRHAHNDYLQLLAETGAVGLLAWAAFVAVVLRRGLGRETEEPTADPPALPPWLLPASGVTACLLLFLAYGGPPAFILLALVWASVPLLLRKVAFEPGPWTRTGAVAGFLGLLVHMGVDFDLYDPGVAFAFFGLAALVLARRAEEADVPRPALLAGAALLGVAGLPLLGLCGPLIAADRELETSPEAARRHNPLKAEAAHAAALAHLEAGDPEAAAEALADAVRLRPRHSPLHATAALVHLSLHRKHLRGVSEIDRGLAAEHLRLARAAQERAVELYPTMPRLRYELARILDRAGEPGAAAAHYAEALRLSDLAARELESLGRLQLDRIQRVRALARLGRAAEARKEAKPLIPLGGEGDVRAMLERLRASPELLRLPPDELDDVTRPVIRDVVDTLLRTLPGG